MASTPYETANRSIKSWAEEDRPREKMLQRGIASLTDAELIAILLSSGTVDLSAVDVAKLVLQQSNNNLNELARKGIKELMQVKGIGQAKAITLVATMELSRRRKDSDPPKRRRITTSREAYEEVRSYLLDKPHEEFWVLLLNRHNELIRPVQISSGGVAGTVVDPKIIFKHALEQLASALILVHNHPSGSLKPSEEDRKLTRKLREAGAVLDIPILDHLIFTDQAYLSFADEGIL
jgi:DNA repair protein RadC